MNKARGPVVKRTNRYQHRKAMIALFLLCSISGTSPPNTPRSESESEDRPFCRPRLDSDESVAPASIIASATSRKEALMPTPFEMSLQEIDQQFQRQLGIGAPPPQFPDLEPDLEPDSNAKRWLAQTGRPLDEWLADLRQAHYESRYIRRTEGGLHPHKCKPCWHHHLPNLPACTEGDECRFCHEQHGTPLHIHIIIKDKNGKSKSFTKWTFPEDTWEPCSTRNQSGSKWRVEWSNGVNYRSSPDTKKRTSEDALFGTIVTVTEVTKLGDVPWLLCSNGKWLPAIHTDGSVNLTKLDLLQRRRTYAALKQSYHRFCRRNR